MADMCEQSLTDARAEAEAAFGTQPEEWEVVRQDESGNRFYSLKHV